MLLFCFVVVIVHAWIFCLCFSQKQSANQAKKIQGNVVLLNWKAHAKIQALLKEKKFHLKKSLTSLLHQAIQLFLKISVRSKFLTLLLKAYKVSISLIDFGSSHQIKGIMHVSMLSPKGGGGGPGICGAFDLYCLPHPREFDWESGSQGGDVCSFAWRNGTKSYCPTPTILELK